MIILKIKVVDALKASNNAKCGVQIEELLHDLEVKTPREEDIQAFIELKNVFSNQTRISILLLLAQADLPVCAIFSVLKLDQTLVSHNLKYLKKIDVVKEEKMGKYRIYSLNKEKLIEMLRRAESIIGKY